MLFKRDITVCVDVKYSLDIHKVIDNYVKTIGMHHVYLNDNKVFIGIETHLSVNEVKNILNEKVRCKSTVVGGCIFLLMR